MRDCTHNNEETPLVGRGVCRGCPASLGCLTYQVEEIFRCPVCHDTWTVFAGSDKPFFIPSKYFANCVLRKKDAICDRCDFLDRTGQDEKPGPTGEYPQGRLNENDEGELKIAVGHAHGKVFCDFGESVTWFALDPDGARDLARMIDEHADKAEQEMN